MKLLDFIKLSGTTGVSTNSLYYNKNYSNEEIKALAGSGDVLVSHDDRRLIHPAFAPIHHKTRDSAGADVQCLEDVTIKPGEMVCITTNLTIPDHMQPDEMFIIAPRSSTYKKIGTIILVNSIGIIESDFPDNVGFQYVNIGTKQVKIKKGTDIGQAVCVQFRQMFPYANVERNGGIGSTDK